MNSLLLANQTENPEEARKPVSLHSGVAKVILLCNLNCIWFLQPYFNKRALIAPTRSFKVNNKDFFKRDNSQDFPPVIILSSINQSMENRRKECHRFWLRFRHTVIQILNVRTSASKKINGIALIRTITASTTAFETTKDNICDFRQTIIE